MNFDLSLFLCALGMAFVLEGMTWALFPGGMRRALTELLSQPDTVIRGLGMAVLILGLLLVALGRL